MATPEERIKERLREAGLDQAPEPRELGTVDELESLIQTDFDPVGDEDIDRLRQTIRASTATQGIRTPRESGLAGFGKGLAEGVTGPLTILGLDADLPPSRIGGFPQEPATGARVLGNIAGTFAAIAPFYAGAHLGLKATGLAGAMSQAEFQFARGAIAGGLFEAGFAEEPEDIPGRVALGATAGGAIDLALFGRAMRKAAAARGEAFDAETAQRIGDMIRRASEREISRGVRYQTARQQINQKIVDNLMKTGDLPTGQQIFNEHGIATGLAPRGGGGVSVAGRAAEVVDNTLLPRGVSVEDLRFASRPEIQAIDEATPGAGEAKLFLGEGTSPAGNPSRIILDEDGTLIRETINPENGTVIARDPANPQSSNMFGENEFPNGFAMPITRAEGKPLTFNPKTGISRVRFTPAEREAMAQAFQTEADPTQIGRFLEGGDQVLTAQEGRVLSSVLNRQLETQMLAIEDAAVMNDAAGFAQLVSDFQELQKAASKLDVYRDPIDAIVDDLKQIKMIENKQAIRRAERFTEELRIDAKIIPGAPPAPKHLVDPDAIAIEQSLVGIGTDEFGDSVTKLASLGKDIDEQLEVTVAKLHSHLNQGGASILPVEPQAVGRITREIKRQLPDSHVVVYKKSPSEHWMLVAGDEIRGPKALVKEDITIEQRALLDGLVEDGKITDIQEMLRILEADVVGELADRPIVHRISTPSKFGVFQDFRHRQVADIDLEIPRVGLNRLNQGAYGQLATLIHEYAHGIFSMQVTQNAKRFNLPSGEVFSSFWGGRADDFQPNVWKKMFSTDLPTSSAERARNSIGGASEVVKMTAYVNGIRTRISDAPGKPLLTTVDTKNALEKGAEVIADNPGYYLGTNELHARALELIFVNRKMAEKLAPNVTKLYLEWIGENSPKMQAILNNKRLARIDEILNEVAHNEVIELRTRRQFFGQLRTSLNAAERAQFRSNGFFTGMTVRYAGKQGFVVGKEKGKILIRDFWSDRTFRVDALSSSNITSNREVAEGAIKAIRGRMHDPPQLDIPVRPMLSTRDDLVRVITLDLQSDRWTLFNNIDEFRATVSESPGQAIHARTAEELAMMSDDDLLRWAANERRAGTDIYQDPHPQIAIRTDDGFYLMADDVAPSVTPEVRARRPGEEPSATGLETLGVYRVTNRSIAESLVRQFGLNERDIPYVIDQVMNHVTKDYLRGLSPSVFGGIDPQKLLKFSFQDVDDAVGSIASLGIKPSRRNTEAMLSANEVPDMALKSGYTVDEGYSGTLIIRKDGEIVATGRKPLVREWLNRARGEGTELNTPELASEYHGAARLGQPSDGQSGLSFDRPVSGHNKAPARPTGDGPGLGGGGGAKPPRFGETLDSMGPPDENFVSQATTVANLAAPFFTGMENFAKTVEQTFGAPAFTRVFKPLQDAIRNVDRAMQAPRQGLKGKSFHDQLKDIEKILFKIHKREEREAITTYLEALSKEEIERAGGLMTRPMTQLEKGMSAEIERLGLAHEMPRLVSTWQLMRNTLKGRKHFMKRYRSMVNQELPPEVADRLQILHNFVTRKRKIEFDDLVEELGLNPAQAQIINELEVIRAAGLKPKDFSLMAVMRHAAADPLPAGAKTMRQAVAKELDLSPQQLQVAKLLEELFDETFSIAGIDQRRYISGYFPHMRVMAQEGILPSDAHMLNALPREAGFTATKFRTGELDVYTREPLTAAVKHVRAMLMHEHFDPELKGVRQALREVRLKDQRSARILQEYVHELQGRPHKSFRKLQTAIQTASKAMGHEIDPGTARSIVNTLASLTYQALIPFRVGLIARNYFQLAQMIPPRTGMADFAKGLRIAMTNEGYEAAKRAGALHEHVTPVHMGESILSLGSTYRLSRRLQRISDVGFRWYQQADEFGRAVAYHAQQSKMSNAIDKYQRGLYGKDTGKALRKMMEEAGVRQFNPVDQREFSRLFLAGKIEEAKSHIARTLSDETMFRYGHANHPAGWGSVYGRLFGQFGTWPIQYKDFLLQGLSRGTRADKARFLTYHIGANVGVVAAGATVGYNLESWVSFPSLWYTGGPYTNVAIDMVKAVSGSEAERGMALRNLKFQFVPTMSDPRAIWIPGSYAIGDMAQMFQAEAGVDQALGFRRYKPGEQTPLDWLD